MYILAFECRTIGRSVGLQIAKKRKFGRARHLVSRFVFPRFEVDGLFVSNRTQKNLVRALNDLSTGKFSNNCNENWPRFSKFTDLKVARIQVLTIHETDKMTSTIWSVQLTTIADRGRHTRLTFHSFGTNLNETITTIWIWFTLFHGPHFLNNFHEGHLMWKHVENVQYDARNVGDNLQTFTLWRHAGSELYLSLSTPT